MYIHVTIYKKPQFDSFVHMQPPSCSQALMAGSILHFPSWLIATSNPQRARECSESSSLNQSVDMASVCPSLASSTPNRPESLNQPPHSHGFLPYQASLLISSQTLPVSLISTSSSRRLSLHLHTMPLLNLLSQHAVHQAVLFNNSEALELLRDDIQRIHRAATAADILYLHINLSAHVA